MKTFDDYWSSRADSVDGILTHNGEPVKTYERIARHAWQAAQAQQPGAGVVEAAVIIRSLLRVQGPPDNEYELCVEEFGGEAAKAASDWLDRYVLRLPDMPKALRPMTGDAIRDVVATRAKQEGGPS